MSERREVGFALGDGCVVTFEGLTEDEEEMFARTWVRLHGGEEKDTVQDLTRAE